MKTTKAKEKGAILGVAFIVLSNSIIASLLAGMSASFPEAGPTSIQLIMTLGMVSAFLSTLAAGAAAQRVPLKAITLAGLAFIAVGGLMPLALHGSLGELYASAILIGIGQGLCIPMVQTYVARQFSGDEKSQMFGWQTASKNAGAMILLLVSGVLAATGWVNAYLVYLVVIPIIALAAIGLPKGEPVKAETGTAAKRGRVRVAPAVWGITALICLFCIGYSTEALNISMFVAGKGLGGATAASLAMSITTGLGILAGLAFDPILKLARGYVFAIASAAVALGNVLIFAAVDLPLVYAASVFVGFGFGLGLSCTTDAISRVSTPEQTAMGMSIYASSTTIGASLSPFVINGLATLAFGELSASNVFLVACAFMVVVAALACVWGFVYRGAYANEGAKAADAAPAAPVATGKAA